MRISGDRRDPGREPRVSAPDRRFLPRRRRMRSRRCCARANRSACWPRAIRSSTARSCICGAGSRADFPVEVVPGVTGMSGCWTRANVPITWGDDTLSVLPGTLEEQQLVERLRHTDAAVIMKVGRNLAQGAPRRRGGRPAVARRLCRARHDGRTSASCRSPIAATPTGAYFAMVLIPGQGRRL